MNTKHKKDVKTSKLENTIQKSIRRLSNCFLHTNAKKPRYFQVIFIVVVLLQEILSRSTAPVTGHSPLLTNTWQPNPALTDQHPWSQAEENESCPSCVGPALQNRVGGPQKSRAVFRNLIAERATQKPADGEMTELQHLREQHWGY